MPSWADHECIHSLAFAAISNNVLILSLRAMLADFAWLMVSADVTVAGADEADASQMSGYRRLLLPGICLRFEPSQRRRLLGCSDQ